MMFYILVVLSLCYAQGIDVKGIVEDLITYPINRLEVWDNSTCFDPLGRPVNSLVCTLVYQYCDGAWLNAYKLDVHPKVYEQTTKSCWPDYQQYFELFKKDFQKKCDTTNDYVCQISVYPAFYVSTDVSFNNSRMLIFCQHCQAKVAPFNNPNDDAFDKICYTGNDAWYLDDLNPDTLISAVIKNNFATFYYKGVGSIVSNEKYCELTQTLIRVPKSARMALALNMTSLDESQICDEELCYVKGSDSIAGDAEYVTITSATLATLEKRPDPYILQLMDMKNYFGLITENGSLSQEPYVLLTACNHTYMKYTLDGELFWHCAVLYTSIEYAPVPYAIDTVGSLATTPRNVSGDSYCLLYTTRFSDKSDMVTQPACACTGYKCDDSPRFNMEFDQVVDMIENGSCYDSDIQDVVRTRSALCVAKFVVYSEGEAAQRPSRDTIYAKSKLDIDYVNDKYCLQRADFKCYKFRVEGQLQCKCCCVTTINKPCNDYEENKEFKDNLLACASGFTEPDLEDQFVLPYLFSPAPTVYPINFDQNPKVFYGLYTAYDTVMEYVTIRMRDRVVLARGILYFTNLIVNSIYEDKKYAYLCDYTKNYINFGAGNCKCWLDKTRKARDQSLDCCCKPNSIDVLFKSLAGVYHNYLTTDDELQPDSLAYRESCSNTC
ncbi:unnamed protein product [Bursaphelenchus okinawaensis]|uniref:Uncharacterized protein n=1 Tax=Bursaphelenchus okinawaensis TaxID=465554 RepID=A0A811LH22_9BILA|nr:unnamed protein product [Bursaphelenchus okinawaensis]CAG9125102.1 unnamed protein product [Bursaphelenchus okinawaensis]